MQAMTHIAWRGDRIDDKQTVDAISDLIWGLLQKQEYADGTEVRAFVERTPRGYFVGVMAKEPVGPPCRLLELVVPAHGLSRESLQELATQYGVSLDRQAAVYVAKDGGHTYVTDVVE